MTFLILIHWSSIKLGTESDDIHFVQPTISDENDIKNWILENLTFFQCNKFKFSCIEISELPMRVEDFQKRIVFCQTEEKLKDLIRSYRTYVCIIDKQDWLRVFFQLFGEYTDYSLKKDNYEVLDFLQLDFSVLNTPKHILKREYLKFIKTVS